MNTPAEYYQSETKLLLENLVPRICKNNYVVLDHTLSYTEDVQTFVWSLSKRTNENSRIIVLSFNFLWKPILNLASYLKLRKRDSKEPNWLDKNDIKNIFYLAGFEEIKSGNRFIFPIDLGYISKFINRYITQLPIINKLCLTSYQIFRKVPKAKKCSVSIIIPARNEEGNIKMILKKIPRISNKMEVIFIEGHSKDNTFAAIKNEIKNYQGWLKTRLLKQKGIGKSDAVRLGLAKAKNEMLIIFDADLSVHPIDIKKFYNALSSGKTELANGSRLIYPLEKQAMATLNIFGNKMFSTIFSYLLGQPIKDTLCGTKAILKKHYELILKGRNYFGDFDPFGDYDLLFGASRLNLKITDIPVRYHERVYGKTNISRFSHGLLLLKMTLVAARKIKFF